MPSTGSISRRFAIATSAVVLLLGTISPAHSEADPPTYRLSAVPRLTPAATQRDWAPFVERLARDAGIRLELVVFRNINEFEAAFAAGELDFAYLNPYHQLVARRQQGYIPLVREGRQPLSGVLVVRKGGPIRRLQDLNGKEIAFPHPNAFGASLYLRALLREQHGIDFIPRYVTHHSNVYRHVLLDMATAGGGVNATLRQEPPEVQDGLTVLYETPSVAPHPLSAHPRVPARVRQGVIEAALALAKDEAGRKLLSTTNLNDPVPADHERDYAVLERLKLDRYYVQVGAQ